MRASEGESGQASVEMVAVLPAVLLVSALLVQLVLAGHAAWACANAARVAARAEVVGEDPRRAAASALPGRLERGLRVRSDDGRVEVRVRVPLILGGDAAPTVGASARLGEGS